jgi:membrane-associated phospholipid phosphatase
MNKRQELYPSLSRTSPVIFLILILLYCIIIPSYQSFYLFITYCLIIASNWIIKHLFFKQLYNLFNTTSLPILGLGPRPANATGCGFILDDILAIDYGMPSGHSQIAWAFATYILCKIIYNFYYNYNDKNNDKKNDKKNKDISFIYLWLILSCIIIIYISGYISYSRVYIEKCHTIQQVIIGGLFGIVFGFIIYYFENDAIKLISNFY